MTKKNAEVCFFVTVGFSFCRVVNGWIKHIWKALNMLSTIWLLYFLKFGQKKKSQYFARRCRLREFALDTD